MSIETFDVVVIGSGMGSLTASCLLAADLNLKVGILEQNFLPGGCTSAYPRKGYVFESGATTLVGLDKGMALAYLLQKIGISLDAWPLELPMQVHFKGRVINRYAQLEAWIKEVEKHFPHPNQAKFWRFAHQVSQKVWQTSLKQLHFPPSSFKDVWACAKNISLEQASLLPYLFQSTWHLLKRFDLHRNPDFIKFIDQQLLITAQNTCQEVNGLFGCTALCYTLQKNFYVKGGLINLVQPLVDFLKTKGSSLALKQKVVQVQKKDNFYIVQTDKGITYRSRLLLSGIPLNNTIPLLQYTTKRTKLLPSYLMPSSQLVSAFQLGIGFEEFRTYDSIHHQIHLAKPLPIIGSESIFLSLNHPQDTSRCRLPNHRVASVSTHIHKPEEHTALNKDILEEAILEALEENGLIERSATRYLHSSGPSSWAHWTQRAYGAVGGYPQQMRIKTWQMKDARLDGEGAYICGDSTYPGQGIPGVALSGLIAFQKIKSDFFA